MLMSKYNGYILDAFGSYQPIFALAGGAYIVGIVVIHVLSPKLIRVPEAGVSLEHPPHREWRHRLATVTGPGAPWRAQFTVEERLCATNDSIEDINEFARRSAELSRRQFGAITPRHEPVDAVAPTRGRRGRDESEVEIKSRTAPRTPISCIRRAASTPPC